MPTVPQPGPPAANGAPASSVAAYRKRRERMARNERLAALAVQEIGPLPEVRDPARRKRTETSFRAFLDTYFPDIFFLPWSPDHLKVLTKVERVVCDSETFAVAMPRGSGKTSICLGATLWAILTGRHAFVYLLASAEEQARQLLVNLQNHLTGNDRLAADWPAEIHPFRALDREARRCAGQRFYGAKTNIIYSKDECVFAQIPGSRASGACVRVAGLTGAVRGAVYVRSDGTQVRPTLVLCDDPQTDASARSVLQTAERLAILSGAVGGMAGPGQRTAILVPCTVVGKGDLADQLLDHRRWPAWHGERTKLVYEWPVNTDGWREYLKLRAAAQAADAEPLEADAYYRQHREAMDAGAVVAWPERYVAEHGELSAIQHAYHLRAEKGERAFAAEYQNEPIDEALTNAALAPADVARQLNHQKHNALLPSTETITAAIDCHRDRLYLSIAGWAGDATGQVLHYQTWPEQDGTSIPDLAPGQAPDAALAAALAALVGQVLAYRWTRADGAELQVARLHIDEGWETPTVRRYVMTCPDRTRVFAAKGVAGSRAGKPLADWSPKPGERRGDHWILGTQADRGVRVLAFDTNYWKSFLAARLATPPGAASSLSLWGADPARHQTYAEHLCAESRHVLTIDGRAAREVWREIPARPNHYLDTLVGCCVAASCVGIAVPGVVAAAPPRKIRLSELQRRH